MTGEAILNYLLQSPDHRADCLDMSNETFQIGAYKHETYGFLIVTAYRDEKPIEKHDGLILAKFTAIGWLESAMAKIREF